MTRPREGPDARSMSPSEAAAKKIADNTIEISRAERDRLFNTVAQQAAEIERLRGYEIAARDLSADLTKVAGDRDEHAARIKELEDAHKRAGAKYAKIIRELRSSVYANTPGLKKQWDEVLAEGKIGNGDHIVGPDQMVPNGKVWQITEERKAALAAMSNLSEMISCPDCGVWIAFEDIRPHMAVLRAMLGEAGQCE